MAAFLAPDSAVMTAIYRPSSVSHSRTRRAAFSGSACVCFATRRVSAGSRRGSDRLVVIVECASSSPSTSATVRGPCGAARARWLVDHDGAERSPHGGPDHAEHDQQRDQQDGHDPAGIEHQRREAAPPGQLDDLLDRRLLERDVLDRQPIAALLVEADRRGDDVVDLLDLRRPTAACPCPAARRCDRRRAARRPTAWRSDLAAECDGS